jgi:hypothetical protein
MDNSLEIWEISAIILLNILHIPLACNYSLMSMILRLGLLMELLSSWISLLQVLSLLSKSSVFSFFLFVEVLGLELRAYTLSHSTSPFPFFCDDFLKIGFHELSAQTGFEL